MVFWFVMEIKTAKSFFSMDEACEKALRQAKDNQYEEELRREGFSDITTYGICFWKKEVMIRRLEP